jgi:SAM-dependent methyltransferase
MSDAQIWHEEDDFWETFAPFMFGEQRWASTAAEIDHILTMLDVAPGAEILDLCCGPGRHSLELARRGLTVTGVDRTATYLDEARRQADSEGLSVEFLQDDMRRFKRGGAFNGALLMFTSFGYFDDPAENRQVLKNIYHSLKDGGQLILDTMGKEVLASKFREKDWHEQEGVIVLQEHKVSRNWSRLESRWIALRGMSRYEFKVAHWIYSAAEISSLLKECGFKSVDIYGDLEGDPYDQNARRLVVVGRK